MAGISAMKFALYDQWEDLPVGASALFAHTEQESVFLSRIWIETLGAHTLTENQSVLLACVSDNDSVLAILPLISCPRDGLRSLSNRFTTLYSLLMSDGRAEDVILSCLADGLSQMAVNSIQLDPIDTRDNRIDKLCQFLKSSGYEYHTYFRFYNWSHQVNGQSFQEYMDGRPSNIRNTVNRKRRKLERDHGYEIQLFQHEKINHAIEDYQKVYRASWKAGEFFADFTPHIVNRLSECGWLRLAILYIEGNPVAAQIWFVVHGKASIYRLTYDEHWKKYSPGSILTEYLMRHVIDEDKVSEIDFLTGNEQYKQDWMTIQKKRLGIHLAKRPVKNNKFSRLIQSLKKKIFSE